MAIPVEANSRSKYAALTQVLRSLLGELYDDSPNELRDEATLNMARLQIIAPPSAREREQIAEATPSDLRDFYEYALLNQGGRSSQPPTVEFGGVEQNANEFWDGVEARVRDDNIDRETVQDVIESRTALPPPGPGDRDPRPSPGRDILPPPEEGDTDPRPARPGGLTGADGDDGVDGASGGGGGGDTWSTTDDTLPADGTARQIPGGEELWHVDGKVYLAYKAPNSDTWMTWHVENPDRLKAIYGDDVPAFDREMSRRQYEAMGPWEGGLSAELQNTSEDPWTQFMSDFNEAAERRPWLKDPTMLATIAGAYLEGRDPTQDELAETDWWNEHSAEERAFMENAVTSGRAQLRENIRAEARKWLGPEFGNMTSKQLDDWTKKVHADPSFGDDLLQLFKQQNRAMFKGYYDGDPEQELTYEDITQPFRNLASNVWGQPFDDEPMLVDIANTHDYTEAAERLRRTGRKRGVRKVWQDMFGALGQTDVGERVVRSAI